MALEKSRLVGGGRLENSQHFSSLPTLGELQYFFQVISEELTMYKIWPVRHLDYLALFRTRG